MKCVHCSLNEDFGKFNPFKSMKLLCQKVDSVTGFVFCFFHFLDHIWSCLEILMTLLSTLFLQKKCYILFQTYLTTGIFLWMKKPSSATYFLDTVPRIKHVVLLFVAVFLWPLGASVTPIKGAFKGPQSQWPSWSSKRLENAACSKHRC